MGYGHPLNEIREHQNKAVETVVDPDRHNHAEPEEVVEETTVVSTNPRKRRSRSQRNKPAATKAPADVETTGDAPAPSAGEVDAPAATDEAPAEGEDKAE